jgi:hypothetical protein
MPWNSSDRSWAHLFCAATIRGMYADGYIPPRTELPTPKEYTEAIEYVCSSAAEFSELEASTSLPLADLLHHCYNAWQDLRFFKCSDGYVGLATPSVKEGDIVRVLLGSANPVVLRKQPLSGSKTHETWNVVNVALVVGLMNGEAIYGDSLLPHWSPNTTSEAEDINGGPLGMFDAETQTLNTNPTDFLVKMGIHVEQYQRDPHRLEVLPETLRAAGVALEEFILA